MVASHFYEMYNIDAECVRRNREPEPTEEPKSPVLEKSEEMKFLPSFDPSLFKAQRIKVFHFHLFFNLLQICAHIILSLLFPILL